MTEIIEGYINTEIGIIPADWNTGSLDLISEVIMGQSPDGASYNENGIGVPLFNGPTEFGRIYPKGIKQWTTSPTKMSQSGDVLFCVRGSTTGRMNIADQNYCIGRGLAAIRGKSNGFTMFIYYLMHYYLDRFLSFSAGSTFPNVSRDNILAVVLPIPPLPEQQKIADILTTVDDHISETEALIEKIKVLKQGMMQQLLTKGIGHTEFKDTEIGRIPVEWKVVELQHMFSRVRTKNTVGNTNVLSISAELGLVSQLEYFNNIYASKNTSNYFLLEKGDFAYNKSYSSGYPMGVIKPLEKYESGIVSPLYICMRPKPDIISNTFYKYYFDSDKLVKAISPIAKEGARNHGLLNVAVPDFFSMPIALPPLQEQRKIAAILTSVDNQIDTYQAKLTSLTRLKTGLMQQLLTGKIRVKV